MIIKPKLNSRGLQKLLFIFWRDSAWKRLRTPELDCVILKQITNKHDNFKKKCSASLSLSSPTLSSTNAKFNCDCWSSSFNNLLNYSVQQNFLILQYFKIVSFVFVKYVLKYYRKCTLHPAVVEWTQKEKLKKWHTLMYASWLITSMRFVLCERS